MTEPRCYWDGPRPCSHDAGEPLPKAGPLVGWMASHECAQRDASVGWDGRITDGDKLAVSRAARERVRNWNRAHQGPDLVIRARHQRVAS